MSNLDDDYRVLDLEPGASLEEVNQAYKDLAFVWHPDRLPKDNLRLQEKAQKKLKELNQARDRLRKLQSSPPAAKTNAKTSATSTRANREPHSRSETRPASSDYRSSDYRTPPPRYQSYQPPPRHASNYSSSSSSSYGGYSSYQSPHSASDRQSERSSENSSVRRSESYRAAAPTPTVSPRSQPDMSGTNLSGADLHEKDLSNRNLSNANLSNANLSDAFLHKVNFSGADLSGANLFRANLLEANLAQANLQGANLIGADLSGADLRGANLQGARIGVSDRLMVKLTGAKLTGLVMPDGSIHT
ncbi:MAG: pentapeptide repeat-containing protein [Pegethrix bostrychoides GSE-TBD4-15B]|jgi:curved DNA-binding protein CbpA|uniref:Pentapeptide repeat-containing protein n=1 Tax=Pegethrix bostrychoides GSE-TBD4-15B TaxID=2839662 RepID=A0A951PG64_9CYAN|nr:pentapeptide repeat-containing protein [Pegethrix bostrychoides GSE-TBD4-15B]